MLTGLPPNKPAGQPLEVTHTLGTDGVLRIVATGPSRQRLDLEYRLRGEMPPEERLTAPGAREVLTHDVGGGAGHGALR